MTSDIFSIIIAILIFSFLVLIHELGHFWAAKRAGVKVLEFGIGFPPRLFKKKVGDTLYSLNLIPFGGFVRMYGEDSWNPKVLKDPQSFASKSVWQRFQITIGGVVMNFLFALIALTIGFSVGIDPLVADYQDLLNNVKSGAITAQSGLVVDTVDPDSLAADAAMQPGDLVELVNGVPYSQLLVTPELQNARFNTITFVHNGQRQTLENAQDYPFDQIGITVNNAAQLPRLKVYESIDGFKQEDLIYRVNDQIIFSHDDLMRANAKQETDTIVVSRDGSLETFEYSLVTSKNTDKTHSSFFVESFPPDSPAQKAGFQERDVLLTVDGKPVHTIKDLRSINANFKNKEVNFIVVRDGTEVDISMQLDESGSMGVYLAPLVNKNGNVQLYGSFEEATLTFGKVQMPVHEAFFYSFSEMWRLGKITVSMFGGVLEQIFSSGTVPDGVAGPVGIAQMTADFVQQGMLSLLRFVALLSLSLAVLNILPIPALDGGRLVFLGFEAITRKKVPAKFEAILHTLGFFVLMTLIVFVTIKDIWG